LFDDYSGGSEALPDCRLTSGSQETIKAEWAPRAENRRWAGPVLGLRRSPQHRSRRALPLRNNNLEAAFRPRNQRPSPLWQGQCRGEPKSFELAAATWCGRADLAWGRWWIWRCPMMRPWEAAAQRGVEPSRWRILDRAP